MNTILLATKAVQNREFRGKVKKAGEVRLVSVDSLSEITFDDGLFKDAADLNGFVRWILRCQAKREAGTLET